jgi:hypothetical protein
MHGDHLVSESMGRMQQVSGVRQQDEILDPLSGAACMIAIGHVSESLHRRSREKRGSRIQTVRMVAKQAGPVEHVPDRHELGKIGAARGEDAE